MNLFTFLLCTILSCSFAKTFAEANEWEDVSKINVTEGIQVFTGRSKKNGLTYTLAPISTPIVKGRICVATEPSTDDGYPHTLEHLIFQGSKKYPYQSFPFTATGRFLAGNLNAFTYDDRTCYVMSAAGSKGFLSILEIYLEAIFFPLLKEHSFVTEIHHITGKGEDAGVVYSEMQGWQLAKRDYLRRKQHGFRLVYPGGSSYQYNMGGALKNLRESTSLPGITDYHKKLYNPANMYVNVVGPVEAGDLRRTLDKFTFINNSDSFVRPFQTVYPQLTKNVDHSVEYASQKEGTWDIQILWRIPFSIWEDIEKLEAIDILMNYIKTGSIEDAYKNGSQWIASPIKLVVEYFSEPVIILLMNNVKEENTSAVEPLFHDMLAKLMDKTSGFLNLEKLHSQIDGYQQKRQQDLENDPSEYIENGNFISQLYLKTKSQTVRFFNRGEESVCIEMKKKSLDYWIDLLKLLFVNTPRVKIIGIPSKAVAEKEKLSEKKRIEERVAALGPAGLAAAEKKLKDAVASVQKAPPGVLDDTVPASASSIKFRFLKSYTHASAAHASGFDVKTIPYKFVLNDIKSNFVRAKMFFSITALTKEELSLVPLLIDVWQKSSLSINGTIQTYEEVAKRKLETFMSFFGQVEKNGEGMSFSFQSDRENYKNAVGLLAEIMQNVHFDSTIIRTAAEARLQKITSAIRNPSGQSPWIMIFDIADMKFYNDSLAFQSTNNIAQEGALKKFVSHMDENSQAAIDKLERIRVKIVQPMSAIGFLSTDVDSLAKYVGSFQSEVWKNFFNKEPAYKFAPSCELKKSISLPKPFMYQDPQPCPRNTILGYSGSGSCFLVQLSSLYEDALPSLPDVTVFHMMTTYMRRVLLDRLRGQGLLYSVGIHWLPTSGSMMTWFFRSPQLERAYEEYLKVMQDHIRQGKVWDATIFETSKGTAIFDTAYEQMSLDDLARSAIHSLAFLGYHSEHYDRDYIKALDKVTLDQVKQAAIKYLPRLLDPGQSMLSIACGQAKTKQTKTFFKKHGYKVEDFIY